MKKTRAKFVVQSVTSFPTSGEKQGENVSLFVVTNGSEENKVFSAATPSGQISLTITNPDAFGSFEQGKECYVDFIPVDAETKE